MLTAGFLKVQVVTDLDGKYIQQIGGSGGEGFLDGTFEEACFNRPQVRGLEFSLEPFIFTVIHLGHDS